MTKPLPSIRWDKYPKKTDLRISPSELQNITVSGECRITKRINGVITVVILDMDFIHYYLALHLASFIPSYGGSSNHFELLNNWIKTYAQ